MPITINGTTGIAGVDGSAATPALQGTDTNTGIAFGSDVIIGSTGGVERWRTTPSGQWLVGTSSARSNFFNSTFSAQLQIEGTTSSDAVAAITRSSVDSAGPILHLAKSRSAVGGNGLVSSSDQIGVLSFQGSDGTEFVPAAYIEAYVDGTPGANSMPGRIVLSTTASGASSPTEHYRITNTGYFAITSNVGLYNLRQTTYNTSSNAVLGIFGSLNSDGTNNGAVYNIEWKMNGNASGQFWYANYITTGGARTLGAYCTGTAWTNSSDIANKEEIVHTRYGLDTVLSLRPVDFRWKSQRDEDGNGKPDIGFIAQEMEQVVPEVVTGAEGSKGISYGNLVSVLTKAIQEQQAMIAELQAKVAALEAQ